MAEPKTPPAPPRQRPAGPRHQRATASLLRLSQAGATRWPSAPALADWMQRFAVPPLSDAR